MNTLHRLSISGVEVSLALDGVTIDDFTASCKHWLPDVRPSPARLPPTLVISVSVGKPSLRYVRNGFKLRGNNGTFHTCLDATVILSRYLERELNLQGRYSIHCSAIAINGHAHVLIGFSGAGKTTIAAACRLRDSRVTVLAGDRAVFADDNIIAGTTTLHFRNGTLRLFLPELIDPLPPEEDMWGRWTTLEYPAVLPAKVPIRSLTLIRLSTGPAVMGSVAAPDDFLRTIEQVAHFGERFPCVALGHMNPIPIFTTYAIQRHRIEVTRKLVERLGVRSLSGGLDEVVDILLAETEWREKCTV